MANKQITGLTADSTPATNDYIVKENNGGTETRKTLMSDFVTFLEAQLTDYSDPTNIGAPTTDGTNLQTDIRAIIGGSTIATVTKDLADLATHIAGTSDNHDAEDITYDSTSDVDTALNTIFNRLNGIQDDATALITGVQLINYNIINFDNTQNSDYYDTSTATISLSEDVLLGALGIDNTQFSTFNYAIDHKLMVQVYKMTKASSYMQNEVLGATDLKITWQEDDNNLHLDKVELDDSTIGIANTEDIKIMIYAQIFKNYVSGIS